jgi:hypothetical protein
MARRTVLDAVVEALRSSTGPRSVAELHATIVQAGLYEFRARDALGVMRSAVRRHLATHGAEGQPAAMVRVVDRDRFDLPSR